MDTKKSVQKIVAEAIANARGMRRGMPPISNVLDLLPEKILEEVMDDAGSVVDALLKEKIIT